MSEAAIQAPEAHLRPEAADSRPAGSRWTAGAGAARRLAAPVVGLLTFAAALLALQDLGSRHSLADVTSVLRAIPGRGVGLALLLTAASFAVMVCYDRLALSHLGEDLPPRRTAWAAWIGCSASLFLGFPLLTSAPVRYRMYGAWGLSAGKITQLIGFVFVTLMLGLLAASAVVVSWVGVDLPGLGEQGSLPGRVLGPLLGLPVAGYLLWAWRGRTSWQRGTLRVAIPSLRIALAQVLLSALEWVLAGAVLYALLPERPGLAFGTVIAAYLLAQIAGLVSQVPGGLGVVETVLVLTLAGHLTQAEVLGGMLAYRIVYILLPFALAIPAYLAFELSQRRPVMHLLACCVRHGSSAVTPHLLGIGAYLAGAWVLVTASLPVPPRQIAWTLQYVPQPVLEGVHLMGSLAGALLLILARGLQRRLDGAYQMTLLALGMGIVLLVSRGDVQASLAVAGFLILLIPMRGEFYRRSSLLNERFTPGWIAAIALAVLSAGGIGLALHEALGCAGAHWWDLASGGGAPRFVRGELVVMGTVLLFAFAKLLRPAAGSAPLPSRADLSDARGVGDRATTAVAHFAQLRDKALLFNETRTAYLMYAVRGRRWIALGDAVGGDQAERVALAWKFRDLCDAQGAVPVFYQVRPESLPVFLDMGLKLLKLGEEARVPVARFTLEGSDRSSLRRIQRKFEKDGYRVRLLEGEELERRLPELDRISRQWLQSKGQREKGFSLGFFDPEYVCGSVVLAVEQTATGALHAFVTLLRNAESREEVLSDLMRYDPECPWGVMDFLLIAAIEWARGQGYAWLNLGMAPLSGIESRRKSPLWAHLAATMFEYGEDFYGFRGIRRFKEKYDPEWRPKYLASPSGLTAPRALASVTALISGGSGRPARDDAPGPAAPRPLRLRSRGHLAGAIS